MPSIRFDFASPVVLIALLALAVAAAAILIYRTSPAPISARTRILLTVLRASALVATALLIGEPTMRLLSTSVIPPGVAVLVDNSRSMRIVDHAGDRAALLRSLLHSATLRNLGDHATVRYFTFGSRWKADPSLPADTLALSDDATDISSAFHNLLGEKERWSVNAVLLLSDGVYNVGRNPLYDALQVGLPVYAVGIGDSSEQRDMAVSRVTANDLVYSGVASPVDAQIRSMGYAGQRAEVTLSEGGKILAVSTLALQAGNREYGVSLSYTPEGEGVHKYTIRVSSMPGELTTANNSRAFFARILKSKLRLLVIAGRPGPDLTILRQTLSEEKNFSVSSFTQRRQAGFYEGALSDAQLDSADCLLLVDMPTAETSPQLMERLKKVLITANRPLMFVGGRDVDFSRLNDIREVLPFTVSQTSPAEQLVFLQPASTERTNPILAADPSPDLSAWGKLPPIFRTSTVIHARPEATVLGYARIQNATLPDPLLLSRSVPGRKSLACIGYGIWRWRLMAQGSSETADLFAHFLQNGIRWLTVPEERRPLRVAPEKEIFSEGEPVVLNGQLYDAAGRPVDNALVHVAAQSGGKVAETDLRSLGNGRYEGTLEGLTEGEYTFQARAQEEGTTVGQESGRFSIGGLNLEFQDTQMNIDGLRELAERTGGAEISPSRFGELDSLLHSRPSFASRSEARAQTVELWGWGDLLAAIILLLVAEWVLRKLNGML